MLSFHNIYNFELLFKIIEILKNLKKEKYSKKKD